MLKKSTQGILNLISTLIMTAIRAYLRRSRGQAPFSRRLRHQHELGWFAANFALSPDRILASNPAPASGRQRARNGPEPGPQSDSRPQQLKITSVIRYNDLFLSDPWKSDLKTSRNGSAQRVVEVRQRLQVLCGNWGKSTATYPRAVVQAVQETMKQLPLIPELSRKDHFS